MDLSVWRTRKNCLFFWGGGRILKIGKTDHLAQSHVIYVLLVAADSIYGKKRKTVLNSDMPSCLLGAGNSGISWEGLLFSVANSQPGFKEFIEALYELICVIGHHNAPWKWISPFKDLIFKEMFLFVSKLQLCEDCSLRSWEEKEIFSSKWEISSVSVDLSLLCHGVICKCLCKDMFCWRSIGLLRGGALVHGTGCGNKFGL